MQKIAATESESKRADDTRSNNVIPIRQQALAERRTKWFGDIVFVRPVPVTVFTFLALAIGIVLIAFLILGTYTQRSFVSGQLVPSSGLLRVYPPHSGTVVEKLITNGQQVKKGENMYVLSSELPDSSQGEAQQKINRLISVRLDSLKSQILDVQKAERLERTSLSFIIKNLGKELTEVTKMLDQQSSRVRLALEAQIKYQKLAQTGLIPALDTLSKQQYTLEQQTSLSNLERDRLSINRQIAEQQEHLQNLPLQYGAQLAELQRTISSVEQELTEGVTKEQTTVVAPEDGVVATALVERGQSVDSKTPVVTIIPFGATLQAVLYAPSRAIGFVSKGDRVRLRYQAFPYEKFGQYPGTISDVAATALSPAELSAVGSTPISPTGNIETIYRLIVILDSQYVNAYGQQQSLRAGTLLDAEILGENRKLYEWLLEPLFAIRAK